MRAHNAYALLVVFVHRTTLRKAGLYDTGVAVCWFLGAVLHGRGKLHALPRLQGGGCTAGDRCRTATGAAFGAPGLAALTEIHA